MDGGEHHRRGSNEFTETSPLLKGDQPRRPLHRATRSVASIPSVHIPKLRNRRYIINLLCFITITASGASGFVVIPITRVVEDTICRHYYGSKESAGGLLTSPINEDDCKGDAIQSKVAFVLAIQSSLEAAVGFLAAFPWGLAADKIGRKPVFAISLFGWLVSLLWTVTVLSFENVFRIEMMWLGSASPFIGGGNAVLVGIILSIIADSTNEEERAVAFMRLHVASLCGSLGAPALSSVIMERGGPWPPLWIAIAMTVTSVIAFLFVPETLKHEHQQDQETHREPESQEDTGLGSKVSHVITRLKESLSILKNPSLILLLLTCLGSSPVLYGTLNFMVQFISRRYGIELFKTGYVQATYGVVQVIQALVILPWLTRYLMNDTASMWIRAADEHHRDLSLARWSYGFVAVGIFILGLAPTLPGFIFGLVLMGLGSGFNSLTRSFMSLYVDPEHRSRLFSLVAMVEVIGSVYAQPFLAGLFAVGLNLGGGWIGLPYYALSMLVAATASLLIFVKVPKGDRSSASTEESGQIQD